MSEETHLMQRPVVYWTLSTVALHYLRRGEGVTKKNLMLELPRTSDNERMLVAMSEAGREFLGFQPQRTGLNVQPETAAA